MFVLQAGKEGRGANDRRVALDLSYSGGTSRCWMAYWMISALFFSARQFLEHAGTIRGDGFDAERERSGDLGEGLAGAHQLQDLELAV